MLNTLLFIHLVIAILLIIVILLQKTSSDGLSGIGGGGGNNMGLVSGRAAANFLTRTTIILGIAFFINAIVIANLSSKSHTTITQKIEESEQETNNSSEQESNLPIAK